MSFKEAVGQESPVLFLKSAYKAERIAHAYLFLGPDEEILKKVATEFAMLLLCEGPKDDLESCGECQSCRKIKSSNHPDMKWLFPEGQFIKIAAVREATRLLNLKGFQSSRKILIIAGASHLNEESSNALLKTLEEPTSDTVIILLADTVRAILPTIISRCQRVVFSSLSEKELSEYLVKKTAASREEAVYLARISEGRLDISVQYHEDGLFKRKNALINDMLNSNCSLREFMDSVDVKERGFSEVVNILSSWFRDLFMAKVGLDKTGFINIDRADDIMRDCGRFSLEEIEERISSIAQALMDFRRNINTRISLAKLRVDLWK